MNFVTRARQKLAQQISARLTLYGLLAALTLMVFTTSIQIMIELNSLSKINQDNLNRLLLSSKLPAQNAVYSYDYNLGAGIVDSLLLNEFVSGVWIYDEAMHEIASGERPESNEYSVPYIAFLIGDPVRTLDLPLQISANVPDKKGLLRVRYNNHLPYQDLLKASWLRLGLDTLTVALLTFFLISIFTRSLTRPLRNISEQLKQIDINDSAGQRLGSDYDHREDELGTLINALNAQFSIADDLMKKNKVALDDAKSSYGNIRSLVESLPHLINLKTIDGKPLLANQAFLKTFRLTEEEYLNQNTADTISDGLNASTQQLIHDADQEAMESKRSVLLPEVDWRLANGKFLALEIRKLYLQYQGQDAILSVGVDITERKEHQAHIQHLAYHDALTDLPNRHLFIDRLEQALLRSQRSQYHGALIFVDLDNFKVINDTKGHNAGDVILTTVATRLRLDVREEDTVARLGGDEFVICMTDLGASESAARTIAVTRANRILESLQRPYKFGSEQLNISASLGLAFFHDHSLNASDLLRHADMAMYRAKEAGKNQLILFEKEMAEANQRLYQLKEDSRAAITDKQFFLMYQPQMNAATNLIIGAEALIRWKHPERGMVSPAEFIPMLESSDMMPEVGTFVLTEAIRQTASWVNQGLTSDNFKMCINVSPQQFRQRNFTDIVISAIRKANIPAKLINLEITEGMIIDDIDHTVASMNELRKAGIHFSIDDFGTGYSNLNYLKRLPLDVLKVDQSFVRDIQSDQNDSAIVRTILAMADQLKLNTVAEGVETEEQLHVLMEMGCHVYQGFLYSPPLQYDEFEQLLKNQLKNEP